MTTLIKYRIIGLTLATIFFVFNVGLPVVVASCPMMKYSNSKRCMMCGDGSSTRTVKFSNLVDKSCCETKYASDRNKTEFLQGAQNLFDSVKMIAGILPSVAPSALITNPRFTIVVNSSPPLTPDIPILVSSLLI